MANHPHHICLITPGHLSSAPRIVKEAEALTAAGYDVTLVSGAHHAPAETFDRPIIERAIWRNVRVRTNSGPEVFLRRLWRRSLRQLRPAPAGLTLRRALALHHPGLHTLVRAAVATQAGFYHGHCVAGLAAAAQAAQARGVAYGFDAEDFHEAESEAVERDARERAIVVRILEAYLPGARLLTAAAPLIAEAYRERYGVKLTTILNVFPRRDAPPSAREVSAPTREAPARLYWFSQTIGPGRGLGRMVAVAGRMRTPVELQLRGAVSAEFARHLERLAAEVGKPGIVKLLPPESPDEMVRLSADAHLGLSLEERRPRNRDLCLTNKVFVYLLAGVPQVLSPTTAQRAIGLELGLAGLVADFDQPAEAAAQLDGYFVDPVRLSASRRHAWELGHARFCWDVEREKFLTLVDASLPHPQ